MKKKLNFNYIPLSKNLANVAISGITSGGGGGSESLTVSNIIITDSSFNNTSNIVLSTTNGYLKILGTGFDNPNVFYSTTLFPNVEISSTQASSSELRLTMGTVELARYNLFVINRNGRTAISVDAFTTLPYPNQGWFAGGSINLSGPVASLSSVDRITFVTDTNTASVRGPLSYSRRDAAAAGNDNYGWVVGGQNLPAGLTCVIDRITFVSDTDIALARAPLSRAARFMSMVSTNIYGWVGGGLTMSSQVNRIDFAADTDTASIRGPLSLAKYGSGATDNDNYGWFGGGLLLSPITVYSRVDRIDFAADTNTASIRGPLSSTRRYLAAAGDDNYGWFGGGQLAPSPGAIVSTVDRITFATDTSTASVRGFLSKTLSQSGSVSDNYSYGWFAGGLNPAAGTPSWISGIDRISFATDTATATARGQLSLNNASSAGTQGLV